MSKVYLRDVSLNDAFAIHRYAKLPEVSRFQRWEPNDYDDTVNHIKSLLEKDSSLIHQVIVSKDIEEVIGAVELYIEEKKQIGELGYVVHPDYWNKGVATKVVKSLLDYGFIYLHLKKIIGTADTRNGSSRKVMEKLGMKEEKVLKNDILLSDGYRDTVVYSISIEEYNKLK